MSENLPEIPAFGPEPRGMGRAESTCSPSSSSSSHSSDLGPHLTTISSRPESASQLYPVTNTAQPAGMMDDDGSYGQQEKSPPELLEAIGPGKDAVNLKKGDAAETPVFMSMMGAAMAAAQLQNMNQQIQMQQYMLLQQQQALIAHAQTKRRSASTPLESVPPSSSPLAGTQSSTAQSRPPTGGMSGQLTAALISAGARSPGNSDNNDGVNQALDLGVTTPRMEKSPGSSDHITGSDVGTLPLVALADDCCTLDDDDDAVELKYGDLTLDVSPDQGPSVRRGGVDSMPGYGTQAWQQFQQLQYNQWSYAAAMSNPWYSQGYPGPRGYGQGGEMMTMRGDTERSGSAAAAAEAVAGIKRRKKPYAAPKGVWRNNGGYNATIYVNKKRIYGPVRRNLADAVSDRRIMEDSVDSARSKIERSIEEEHKIFESDQARESFIAEECHTMIREVVAKLRAERGSTHNSTNPVSPDHRPPVQTPLVSQRYKRPGIVPSLAQAVYGTAPAVGRVPGNMMPLMMPPYPSTAWSRSVGSAKTTGSPLLLKTRKRDRSEGPEEVATTAKADSMLPNTGLAHSVIFGGGVGTTSIEIPTDPSELTEGVTTEPKRARTTTPVTATTSSSSTTTTSYVPLSPLFNPGSPPLSSRMFSSALPKYLQSPAFPATQLASSRGAPPLGSNVADGSIMDGDIQLEESAVGSSGLYPKGMQTSFGFPMTPTFLPYQTTPAGTTLASASSASSATTTAAAGAVDSATPTPAPSTLRSLAFTSPGLLPAPSHAGATTVAATASFWTPHLHYLKHSPAFASQSSAAATEG